MGAFSYISPSKTLVLEVGADGPINTRAFQSAVILLDPYCTAQEAYALLGKTKKWIRSSDAKESICDLMIAINVAKGRAARGLPSANNFTAVRRYADPHTTILNIVARVAVDEKEGVRLSRKTRQSSSDAGGAIGASVFSDVAQKLSCDREYPCPEWELVPMTFDGAPKQRPVVPKVDHTSQHMVNTNTLGQERALPSLVAGKIAAKLVEARPTDLAWVNQYLVRG